MGEDADIEDYIVNDILCYVQCMINTLQRDQLVKLIVNHYANEQEIVTARDVLYRNTPPGMPGPRLIKHKDKDSIAGSIFDVMHRIGSAAPNKVFVCRNLRNIPPLSVQNLDPVSLFNQNNDVKARIETIQKSSEQQLGIIMDSVHNLRVEIREIKVAMQPQLTPISQPGNNQPSLPVQQQAGDQVGQQQLMQQQQQQPLQSMRYSDAAWRGAQAHPPSNRTMQGGNAATTQRQYRPMTTPAPPIHQTEWVSQGAAQPPSRGGRGFWEADSEGFRRRVAPPRRRPTGPPPLIGTGKHSRLQVVKAVRRCNIFVSRLSPTTTEDDISRVVQDITGEKPIKIEKLKTRRPSYSSFHVVADEAHREALLTSDAWDEGTLVKKFYAPRLERRHVISGNNQENLDVGNMSTTDNISHSLSDVTNQCNLLNVDVSSDSAMPQLESTING